MDITEIFHEISLGNNIDKWTKHKSWFVRSEVARLGYSLEELSHDDSIDVLWQVARHGYKPEMFWNHENSHVRSALARSGADFDHMINDSDANNIWLLMTQGFGFGSKEFSVETNIEKQTLSLKQIEKADSVLYLSNDYMLQKFYNKEWKEFLEKSNK